MPLGWDALRQSPMPDLVFGAILELTPGVSLTCLNPEGIVLSTFPTVSAILSTSESVLLTSWPIVDN